MAVKFIIFNFILPNVKTSIFLFAIKNYLFSYMKIIFYDLKRSDFFGQTGLCPQKFMTSFF